MVVSHHCRILHLLEHLVRKRQLSSPTWSNDGLKLCYDQHTLWMSPLESLPTTAVDTGGKADIDVLWLLIDWPANWSTVTSVSRTLDNLANSKPK